MTSEAPLTIHAWRVPLRSGSTEEVLARIGRTTTFVGRNGAGKSALASWMSSSTPNGRVLRVLAQRRVWFTEAAPTLTAQQNIEYSRHLADSTHDPRSRWVSDWDEQRAGMTLYALLARINDENRRSTEAFRSGRSIDEVTAIVGVPLLDRINRVLQSSGLMIQIQVDENQSFTAIRSDVATPYPIPQMSDGEKNAMFLAAEILTAKPRTIIILDEPERHLHRSISSGLIAALVAERNDCSFTVFTHDLGLAKDLDAAGGATYVVAGVQWAGSSAHAWELFSVTANEVPEDVRSAILGGRSKIMYVEGTASSLDSSLYSLLYPDWSVHPAGGNSEVRRNVAGLRKSEAHHWLTAVGIVDGDGRSENERAALRRVGVLALPVAEVENLYYIGVVLEAVAGRQASIRGQAIQPLLDAARQAGIGALTERDTIDRLSMGLAVARVQRTLADLFPTTITEAPITVSTESPLREVRDRLIQLANHGDYDALVREAPIRDTAFRSRVADALGFKNHKDFERAARTCIADSDGLRGELRALLNLPTS